MDKYGVTKFLIALGIREQDILDTGRGWLNCKCPMSPYAHRRGADTRPSFGVSVSDKESSVYYCFGCSDEGKPLGRLLHAMWVLGAPYPFEAAKIYASYEVHDSDAEGITLRDEWEIGENTAKEPLPSFVYEQYPLLEATRGVEGRKLRAFLAERNIPEFAWKRFKLRCNPENSSFVFPMTDVHGRIFLLRERTRVKKSIWTISSKLAGYPHMEFPKLRNNGIWFGLHLIDWDRPVMTVEGEFDAMSTVGFGFMNVIASCTSSVTAAQLGAVNSDIIFSGYDADKAGDKACARVRRYKEKTSQVLKIDWTSAGILANGEYPEDPGDIETEKQFRRALRNAS